MPAYFEASKVYPSDLNEAQWNAIKDFIPSARSGGRSRTTSSRAIVNAVFYLVKTGCSWRCLPKTFPPWATVYYHFKKWIHLKVWEKIHEALRDFIRDFLGRDEHASYLIIDSQSAKAASGEERAYDGFKHVRGRKRQIVVDTLGLLHHVYVHKADLSDTKEGAKVFERLPKGVLEHLKVMNADQGYRGSFERECELRLGFLPLILKRENTGQGKKKTAEEKKQWRKQRQKLKTPKRWIVERTFAWLNGYRRLSRDYEKKVVVSETMIYLAMTQLMLRKLTHLG